MDKYYTQPYNRISPFILGMLIGYQYYNFRKNKSPFMNYLK